VSAPAAPVAARAPAVEALAVERRYRGGRGAGPVDLRVERGEVLALMGPNGAGKTTLLRLLASVDRPRRGSLRWFGGGVEVARRSLGLALDSAIEEATLSGMQASYFWCRQWIGDGAVARVAAAEALRDFGLWEVRDEPVAAYSFGMRRRLALAQALAHDPALVLLDEPTAGLDPAGVQALVDALRRRGARGQAGVVASNDPNFTAAAADRVAFLSRGLLVRCAPPAELLAAVSSGRVADLELSPTAPALDPPSVEALPGVERVDLRPGGATVRFRDPALLPRIVAAADHPGGRLRQLRLHEPDLADAFRELTGEELQQEAVR